MRSNTIQGDGEVRGHPITPKFFHSELNIQVLIFSYFKKQPRFIHQLIPSFGMGLSSCVEWGVRAVSRSKRANLDEILASVAISCAVLTSLGLRCHSPETRHLTGWISAH